MDRLAKMTEKAIPGQKLSLPEFRLKKGYGEGGEIELSDYLLCFDYF